MSSESSQPRRASRRGNRRTVEANDQQAAARDDADRRRLEAINQRRQEAALRGRPANENDAYAAGNLQAIRRRTPTTPIWAAAVLTIIWFAIWTILYVPALAQLGSPFSFENMPTTMRTLLVAVLPALMFMVLGYLIYRANQMNNVSQALMQTAMRLVRPQDVATESLASVSQLVRREVDQLVGGVEHAVQRASELEGVIHKEMANIERAFGANEERVRVMLEGLENQRNALHETGMIIGTEASPLLSRLEENTHGLSGIIATASSTLAALEHNLKSTTVELSQTVDEISSRASFVGTEISGQTARMEQMSGTLVNEMRLFSENVTGQVSAMQETAMRLNSEGMQFTDNLRMLEGSVSGGIRESLEELRGVRSELGEGIEHLTSSTAEQMRATAEHNTELMKLTGDTVTQTIRSSSEAVAGQLRSLSEEYTGTVNETGERVTERVRQTSGEIIQSVEASAENIAERMRRASSEVVSSVEILKQCCSRRAAHCRRCQCCNGQERRRQRHPGDPLDLGHRCHDHAIHL